MLYLPFVPFTTSLELAKKTRAEQEDSKLETKPGVNSRITECATEQRLSQRPLAPNQAEPVLDSSYHSQLSLESLFQGRPTGAGTNELLLARFQQQGMGVQQDHASLLGPGGMQGSSIFSGIGGVPSEGINQQQLLLLQQLQLQLQQQQAASMVNPYYSQLQLLQEEQQLQQYQMQQLQMQAAGQAPPPSSVNAQLQYQLLLQQLEREQAGFTIQRDLNNKSGSHDNTDKK